MYNGIGLTTARGSGTNGFVQRNISAIRQTKEKVPDSHEKEDSAVRPFDPELVEHERRRQAEVRCMELRDLLEEQDLPESEINEKVNAFRAKLLAEKKLTYQRDSSGRPMVKDSHEFSVAQEQKNTRAKDAFGISDAFIPGSSLKGREVIEEMSKEEKETPTTTMESVSKSTISPESRSREKTSDKEKAKKRKKSHKRSKRSSSSDSSSSDEESHRKKRKKEKKSKKSKKSHRHRRDSDSNSKNRKRNRSDD